MAEGSRALFIITLGVVNICYYTTSQFLISYLHYVLNLISPTSAYSCSLGGFVVASSD